MTSYPVLRAYTTVVPDTEIGVHVYANDRLGSMSAALTIGDLDLNLGIAGADDRGVIDSIDHLVSRLMEARATVTAMASVECAHCKAPRAFGRHKPCGKVNKFEFCDAGDCHPFERAAA